MTLGSKLQSLRESQGISQKDLANCIGVTTGVVAEWESDETTPNLVELSHLSKALNVSADVLLDTTIEATATPVAQPMQTASPIVAPIKKRMKTGWIIGAFTLIVLIVIAILMFSESLKETTPPTEAATVPTDPLAFSEDTSAIESADASVVTIFCYDYDGELAATGSGFVAFDSKTIITNYHVMTSAYTCKISTNQDISYEVPKILCYSKEQDIAILQLAKDTNLQPLTLGDSGIIKKGETVVAIGSPLGIKNTVSTGVLSGRLMDTNMDVLQFTAPISSGSSGGALFDNNGNVVGITFASYDNGQNLNLAIPIELAIDLYNIKGAPMPVSKIHIEENPYVVHLEKYKDIPKITIDALLNDPQKYDGQTIVVSGYFSSFYCLYTDTSPEGIDMLLIAPFSKVTGNGEADYDAVCNSARYGHSPNCIPIPRFMGGEWYINESLKPGDKICWIGEFFCSTLFDGGIIFSTDTHLIYGVT